jgi:octaprenyl-diphosphate synthase
MLAAEPKAAGAALADPLNPAGAPAWKAIVAPVEPFLRTVAERLAEQVAEFEPEVAAHARYALMSQGKQLRPALVGLSGEATGGLNSDLVTAATIIEMVHLATLVHDDVVDEAAIRRRRPTLAVQAGNTTSVLVGDCLFAHALKLAAGFPTTEVCRAVSTATKTVCTGEIIQSQRQHQLRTSRAEYFRVLRMKTAELFAVSCELGAHLSGGSPGDRQVLRDFGMALGTAYQVYDDCLDVFGSEARAGKSLRTDLVGGKPTLPVIVAWERATPDERRFLERMVAAWDPGFMRPLVELFERTQALPEARAVIRSLCSSAQAALRVLPRSVGRERLAAAAEYIAHQTDDLGV